MHDACGRGDDTELAKGLLAPAQELVAFAIALELELGIAIERLRRGEEIDLHRVIHDQVDGDARVDLRRIAAQPCQGIPHGGQVDDGRHTGEILHQDARREEGDLGAPGSRRCPTGEGNDVGLGDAAPIDLAKHGLQQYAQGEWRRASVHIPDARGDPDAQSHIGRGESSVSQRHPRSSKPSCSPSEAGWRPGRESIIPSGCPSAALLRRGPVALLVWLLPGSGPWPAWRFCCTAGTVGHRRDLLTVYLRSLVVLDVWRGTLYALAATPAGCGCIYRSVASTLTPRLISPVVLLRMLIVYAAQGTPQATWLILILVSWAWSGVSSYRAWDGGATGLGGVPRPVGDLLLLGTRARLVEPLALTVGVLRHCRLPIPRQSKPAAWISGSLALLDGGDPAPRCSASARAGEPVGSVGRRGRRVGLSTAALLPVAIVFLPGSGPRTASS